MPALLRVAVLVVLLSPGALADDWTGPRVANVFSADGIHFVRIIAGASFGETVGFTDAPKGAHARAEFYTRQADRSYRLMADVKLRNPVAPVDALMSNAGYLITFDNWHNAGYGQVVAIYGQRGAVIASYELEQLYPTERIPQLPNSVSSRWWRCSALAYLEPATQTAVYVMERLGGTFVFQLATGCFEYRPGRAECQ